jgi:DNA-binding response OmpR family regulator
MNVVVYSKNKDLSVMLQSSLDETNYRIYHASDIGTLHFQFFQLDSIDLLIICNDVTHSSLDIALKNMSRHSRFFPVLCIDLGNSVCWAYQKLFSALMALPETISRFTDIDFLKCLEIALNRTFRKIKFSTTEKQIVDLLQKNESISLETISYHLWNEYNEQHKKTLYGYIHNIRNRLNDNLKRPQKLVRLKNGMYQLKQ